ncbi:MAG: formylglycine-generating enzyme family protein [Planctomycetaceae bacterium]
MPTDFLTLMLDGCVPMKFRLIPPGEFRMGSRGVNANEEPIHQVKITKPFYIGVYPVTQLQWRTIVATQDPPPDLNPAPSSFKGDDRPVERVNWHDSQAWCQLLNHSNAVRDCVDDAEERIEVASVDLPTEAQWEYACRLVQTQPHLVCCDTEYHTGDGEAALSAAGWFRGNSDQQTHDVGGKEPNGIGLYDMHGNVWEWCRDAWSEDAYKLRIDRVADPLVSASDVGNSENDADRVFRGGSWNSSARNCRAAARIGLEPDFRNRDLGFRVCLFFGPVVPSDQPGTEVTSEPVSGDAARRQAAAKSDDSGGDVTEVDLSNASLPKRSDGTKF